MLKVRKIHEYKLVFKYSGEPHPHRGLEYEYEKERERGKECKKDHDDDGRHKKKFCKFNKNNFAAFNWGMSAAFIGFNLLRAEKLALYVCECALGLEWKTLINLMRRSRSCGIVAGRSRRKNGLNYGFNGKRIV